MAIESIQADAPTRICKTCNEQLPLHPAFFHGDKTCTGGFKPKCKVCSALRRAETRGARVTYSLLWAEYNAPKGTRVCSSCLEAKPEDQRNFARHRAGRHGLSAECKSCFARRERPHEGQPPNQDESFRKQCSVCCIEKPATAKYFYAHRYGRYGVEGHCKDCRLARRDNEAMRLYQRSWYAEKSDEIQRRRREKQWQRINEHRAMKAAHRRKRRAYQDGNGGEHTQEDIERKRDEQGHKCYYCLSDVSHRFEVDHYVPISRGGSNGPRNLVISCPDCNRSKGDKMPDHFMEYYGMGWLNG